MDCETQMTSRSVMIGLDIRNTELDERNINNIMF